MSWMDSITDEQRAEMQAINANLNHARVKNSGARYFGHDGEKVVEKDRAAAIVGRSFFPYPSLQMACEPEDIQATREMLRRHAKGPAMFTEFERDGSPIITSQKQHDDLAETLGMKSGRDGYGHFDEHGNFQNSGRRRNDEIQEGRRRVRKAREELLAMPEDVPVHTVQGVLDEYDIAPTEDNTG